MRPISKIVIAIPCYNEAHRLRAEAMLSLLDDPRVHALLVDDGSTDGTGAMLAALKERAPDRVEVLALPVNQGKAEAVRRGLLHALDSGAAVVGYLDADLSTPPAELLRLAGELDGSGACVVLGARVAMLGARIERRAARHYAGRVFATLASIVLGAPVYDTQCGAKVFRGNGSLREALQEPFHSRWAFDVELLGRLMALNEARGLPRTQSFVEVPLRCWIEAPGSSLRLPGMLRAGAELLVVHARLRAFRRHCAAAHRSR
jgi:glycosyltransferase involved in cell wall biosynthesis